MKQLFLSFTVCCFGFLYAQTTIDQTQQTNPQLPADFPKYVDTGNPELDGQNYQLAKEKWIKENPDKYAALNGTVVNEEDTRVEKKEEVRIESNQTGPQKITKAAFDNLPDLRKEYVLAHPELFIIE